MGHFFSINYYDIIDMVLWGALTFLLGVDFGHTLTHKNQKPNKRKGEEEK